MMYPHHHYGGQLVPSPATPLFSAIEPSPSRKRLISDVDSTDDDLDSKSLQLADSNMDGNCHLVSRKKRRGMIEKRRRDRINNSLHELKRLVPAAFEKQGSAKLEKAEILQLTVDHLRSLHSKGFDAFSFDPHKFATDYHVIGFREAAAEVARYLVVHEGLDFQDPLRLRLISHLQCYSAQRELSLKSSTGWNPSLFTTPMYPPPPTSSSSTTAAATSSIAANTCDSMTTTNSGSHHNSYGGSSGGGGGSYYTQLDNPMMPTSSSQTCSSTSAQPKSPSSTMSSSSFTLGYTTAATSVASIPTPPSASTYSYSYPAGSYFGPSPPTYMTPMVPTTSNNAVSPSNSQAAASVKHYRPWGTELAY